MSLPNNLHRLPAFPCSGCQSPETLSSNCVLTGGQHRPALCRYRLPPTDASPLCWQRAVTTLADSWTSSACAGVLLSRPVTWVATALHQTIIRSTHHRLTQLTPSVISQANSSPFSTRHPMSQRQNKCPPTLSASAC